MQGFERMLSYEQYPEEKSRLWLSPLKKIDQSSWKRFEVSPFFFFLVVFTSESGNLLTSMKNIHFSSSLERPMETSWRNTTSRHRDNVLFYPTTKMTKIVPR